MYFMHSSRRLVHLGAVWNDPLIEIKIGPVFFYEKRGMGKYSGWSTPHKHQMFVLLVVIDELHPLLLIILHIWALQLHVGIAIGALQLKKIIRRIQPSQWLLMSSMQGWIEAVFPHITFTTTLLSPPALLFFSPVLTSSSRSSVRFSYW